MRTLIVQVELMVMTRLNCWEATQCGMEHVCLVYKMVSADGYLGGKNAGRGCAFVAPTFCDGSFQASLTEKEEFCKNCNFYWELKHEHGEEFSATSFFEYLETDQDKKKRVLIAIH